MGASEKVRECWAALTRLKPVSVGALDNAGKGKLSWFDLTAYGIAATVGSGIFATLGTASREFTHGSVTISALFAGSMALMTALCYLDFASKLPISGSCKYYTIYSYSSNKPIHMHTPRLVSWWDGLSAGI